jgi:hypothetical protein
LLDITMDVTVRKEIEKIKADPDFVEFVMAWHGESGATTQLPFAEETQSQAYQKKAKRWMLRDFGTEWKSYWKVILNECWKTRRKMVLERNLFRLEPRGTNPNHRPPKEGRWNAIFDLRNYFTKIDSRPHMRLLGQLFYPDQEEDTFITEWNRRKDWFKEEKGDERLQRLEVFYRYNRERIRETLRTGIPLYAKWESNLEPVRPVANP